MELDTWGGGSRFRYTGSVDTATRIEYGKRFRHHITVSAKSYAALRKAFVGKGEVPIGTCRKTGSTAPPRGSIGEWLANNVSKTAIASYVGPILLSERYAVRGAAKDEIRIVR